MQDPQKGFLDYFLTIQSGFLFFSDKVSPLVKTKQFPLCIEAEKAFRELKVEIEKSVVHSGDESVPFQLECDASDIAIAAVLNQGGRRTLHGSELKWPSVEKEAIIEAIRHWQHYITGHHFTLITDQKSVSYMFNTNQKGKIKNDKMYRWRLVSCYSFDIMYGPGKDNIAPDVFSRVFCSAISTATLYQLHNSLCHSGVTRFCSFQKFTIFCRC